MEIEQHAHDNRYTRQDEVLRRLALKSDTTHTHAAADHGALSGLTDDDHTQYVLLAGRTGGQIVIGGTGATDDLTLKSQRRIDIQPIADSTDAVRILNAAGTPIVTVDTTFSQTNIIGRLTLEDCTAKNKAMHVGAASFLHNFHHPTGGGAIPNGRNLFVGEQSGNFTMGETATANYHASYNTGMGTGTLTRLTLGSANNATGYNSGSAITTGSNNNIMGNNSLRTCATGGGNCAVGSDSLPLATGNNNVGIGLNTLYNMGAGSDNVAIGTNAGRYQADGTTALTTAQSSIYIGTLARGKDNSDSNSIVIGHTAIGLGANTTVIGKAATTLTRLFGVTDTDGLVVNESGGSAAGNDMRAESDTEANMLWLDASADALYLGGSTNGLKVAKGGIVSLIGSAIRSPASGDAGVAGEICWDADYVHVCTAANTWKRAALAADSDWIEATPGTDWDFTSLNPSGATTGRYRKLNGVVYLSGAVRCTDTGSAVAFTLPVGYRPAHLMRYGMGLRYSSGGTLRSDTVIRVDTNGEVLVATSVANDSTHFDGVCFPV